MIPCMECAVTKAKLKEALEIIRRQDASLEAGATAMARAGQILDISADRLMNLGLAYEAVKAERGAELAALRGLIAYTRHTPACQGPARQWTVPCSCGYAEAHAALDAARAANPIIKAKADTSTWVGVEGSVGPEEEPS